MLFIVGLDLYVIFYNQTNNAQCPMPKNVFFSNKCENTTKHVAHIFQNSHGFFYEFHRTF